MENAVKTSPTTLARNVTNNIQNKSLWVCRAYVESLMQSERERACCNGKDCVAYKQFGVTFKEHLSPREQYQIVTESVYPDKRKPCWFCIKTEKQTQQKQYLKDESSAQPIHCN